MTLPNSRAVVDTGQRPAGRLVLAFAQAHLLEAEMFPLEIGQELEFIEPAHTEDGVLIPKGTRVRIGFIMPELLESNVTLVVLNGPAPQTLTVPRHIVTVHCQPVQKGR
jgi:hypothetical protein